MKCFRYWYDFFFHLRIFNLLPLLLQEGLFGFIAIVIMAVSKTSWLLYLFYTKVSQKMLERDALRCKNKRICQPTKRHLQLASSPDTKLMH